MALYHVLVRRAFDLTKQAYFSLLDVSRVEMSQQRRGITYSVAVERNHMGHQKALCSRPGYFAGMRTLWFLRSALAMSRTPL